MSKYRSEIVVPITLTENVKNIEFKQIIEVSLDCYCCERYRRTVILYKEKMKSFCTPTRHPFPGKINTIDISCREKVGEHLEKVTAIYTIEYDFEEFIDKKYPDIEITPKPRWGRATFKLTCICGSEEIGSTQNNIRRPWSCSCKCGSKLYDEVEEIPIFRDTKRADPV